MLPYMNRTLFLAAATCAALNGTANPLFLHGNEASCGNPTGWLTVEVNFGAPPYTYLWSNSSTNDTITQLYAGWYTVTVTDVLLQAEVDSIEVLNTTGLLIPAVWSFSPPGSPACPGMCDGKAIIYTQSFNGLGPYSITFDQGNQIVGAEPQFGDPVFGGFCSGTNSGGYTVVDQYGCSGTGVGFDVFGAIGNMMQVLEINAACAGGANGSVLFTGAFDPGLGIFGGSVTILDDQSNVVNSVAPSEPLLIPGLLAGDYTARVGWESIYGVLPCTEDHPFTIPDLGTDCGSISGALFVDHNADCTQEPGDIGIPYHVMEITPGPEFTITDGGGHYLRNLAYGSFTLDQLGGTDLLQLCPVASPIPFDINAGSPAVLQDIADSSLIPLDVTTWLSASHARPGFQVRYYGIVRNVSAQLSGALEVTFTYDPLLTYTSADPPPTSVVANTVTWSLPGFGSYGTQEFNIYLQIPPDQGLIGYVLNASLNAAQPLAEINTANNTYVDETPITGGFDPNDKTARTSTGQSDAVYVIDEDEYIDYVIRFQNTGNDTTINVVVTDTLDSDLDMATFEQGPASDPFTIAFRSGRVIEWRFENILLPDSGTNEAESHGLVSFRIRPAQPLLPGTVLSNTANIFFDFNDPVITGPSVLTAEFSTTVAQYTKEVLSVFPNPATSTLHVISPSPAIHLRVLSCDGRMVMNRSNVPGSATIDIQQLPSGAYSVEAVTTKGAVHRARFFKE